MRKCNVLLCSGLLAIAGTCFPTASKAATVVQVGNFRVMDLSSLPGSVAPNGNGLGVLSDGTQVRPSTSGGVITVTKIALDGTETATVLSNPAGIVSAGDVHSVSNNGKFIGVTGVDTGGQLRAIRFEDTGSGWTSFVLPPPPELPGAGTSLPRVGNDGSVAYDSGGFATHFDGVSPALIPEPIPTNGTLVMASNQAGSVFGGVQFPGTTPGNPIVWTRDSFHVLPHGGSERSDVLAVSPGASDWDNGLYGGFDGNLAAAWIDGVETFAPLEGGGFLEGLWEQVLDSGLFLGRSNLDIGYVWHESFPFAITFEDLLAGTFGTTLGLDPKGFYGAVEQDGFTYLGGRNGDFLYSGLTSEIIDQGKMVAVPEPTSLVMFAMWAPPIFGGLVWRRRTRSTA